MPLAPESESPNEANNMPPPAYPTTDEARYAALQTQVQGLDSDYKELKGIVVGLDRKIDKSNADLSAKMDLMTSSIRANFDTAITGINAKIEKRNEIPWQAWSLAVSVFVIIGAFAYWPIREKQSELKDDNTRLVGRIERVIEQGATLRDVDIVRQRMDREVTFLQRQYDDMNRRQGDTYTARDALMHDRQRIDQLEGLIREILRRP